MTVQKERSTEASVPTNYSEAQLEKIKQDKGYHRMQLFASVLQVMT